MIMAATMGMVIGMGIGTAMKMMMIEPDIDIKTITV